MASVWHIGCGMSKAREGKVRHSMAMSWHITTKDAGLDVVHACPAPVPFRDLASGTS